MRCRRDADFYHLKSIWGSIPVISQIDSKADNVTVDSQGSRLTKQSSTLMVWMQP